MLSVPFSDPELLKSILEPLLEDFQYWFGRTRTLLEAQSLAGLSPQDQADLLRRLVQTQREVSVAQSLLAATNGQAGVDPVVLGPWHQLVLECWQVGVRSRQQSA
jgi:hypothetical protein